MNAQVAFENRAQIARITCGWKKPDLPIDAVRRYWRDVHSPAIARRAGMWEYRHSQFGAVRAELFGPVGGVRFDCAPDRQLMWLSDVRYPDQAGLDAFGKTPPGDARAHLLGDIELLVDQSSTYKVVGDRGLTLVDTTGEPIPQGPALAGSHAVFFREVPGMEAALHAAVAEIARRWAASPGVRRVRVNLFEAPDMEAEKRGGYPIKTHPKPLQYQAWIDLVLEHDAIARDLLGPDSRTADVDLSAIREIHAYPVDNLYTFIYGGRPTLVGLRGYAAYEAIRHFDAVNQRQVALLEWMYGPIAAGGPVEAVR